MSRQGAVIAQLPQELQRSTLGSLHDEYQRVLSPQAPQGLQLPMKSMAVKCDRLLVGSWPEFSLVAGKAVTPKARPANAGESLSALRSCYQFFFLAQIPNFLHL